MPVIILAMRCISRFISINLLRRNKHDFRNSQLPTAQNGTAKKVSIQPIEDMQFAGLHWIEASAGTGKTYTLSSLMVRIFLEKYLPSQVIATTFTRKAAAELKTRIRLRLQETYRYFDSCRELTEAQVLTKAAQESDPLFSKC
jgi:exodeoxyribonuclease V beta subunit